MTTHHVTGVRAEYADPTPWVGTARPRLSWRTVTAEPDWHQTAAELRCAGETVRLEGPASVQVEWPFAPLTPREPVEISVRTAGPDGVLSEWSSALEIRSALFDEQGWSATPIEHPETDEPAVFRKEIVLRGPVRRATLYAAARGTYQVSVNGVDVDDHVLKPGWSSFALRLPYETTDVTSLLATGTNVVGIRLAGGWYTERYHRAHHDRPTYGDRPSVAGQLVVEYADGTRETMTTDASWSASTGEIVASSIYLGETVDARRAPGPWLPVRTAEWAVEPTPRIGPPAVRIEELPVRTSHVAPSGATILDFGQNLTGRLRIRVRAPRGTTLTVRHAEVLEDAELALRPLRTATSTDVYVHAGGERVWEPEFTFHGFRYASIEGLPGLSPADVTAVVLHSELTRTAWFSCSDPLVTKLHENVVWSTRDNFLHLPTDCPQRDERQGWTGDIQVFAPTAATLFDVNGFLASWLTDLRLEQAERGAVPFIVPDVETYPRWPAAAWGDAATIVPWVLHTHFADRQLLAGQFASMTGWVDQVTAAADDDRVWRSGPQFGDWLDPDAPSDDPARAKVPAPIVATAYFFRSAGILAAAAGVLGETEVAERYRALAAQIKQAWTDAFLADDGARIVSDAPTAYALAIEFGLVDRTGPLGARLAELVEGNGHRISTGFVGTPIVADALTRTGHVDEAGRMLLQRQCPGWLYPVTMGATTVWERWDSMLPDGSVNPGEMTSFNHYALGAVVDWLHRVVAGLAPDRPGYARQRIAPQPIAGLDHAASTVDTPYGPATVAWTVTADATIRVDAEVPPNTTARVELPGRDPFEIGAGRHHWTITDPRPAG